MTTDIEKLLKALEPFATVGQNIPSHWRGDVALKQQVGKGCAPPKVECYREAARVFAEFSK